MYVLQRHEWSPQRLLRMLEDCQFREKENWRNSPLQPTLDQQTQISPTHRDYAVTWISHLNVRFNFYPETFFLAVQNLDRFLTTVKSHPKYLKCIAATCLYIASKIMEEEEHIPGALELVEVSQAGCRPGDIIRMEKIILSKLNWDFHIPTALTYMEIFFFFAFLNDVMRSVSSENSFTEKVLAMTKQLSELTEELQRAVCSYTIAPFKSATIALALLSLRAGKLQAKSNWPAIIDQIQAKIKIKQSDLDQCRYALQTLLPRKHKSYANFNNAVYVITTPNCRSSSKEENPANHSHQSAPIKRKAHETGYHVNMMECVKKFHQIDDKHPIGDDPTTPNSPQDKMDGPCLTVNTVKGEAIPDLHPPELTRLCPPLEKLTNCNSKLEPEVSCLKKKRHLTYAEIVRLGTMTVCEE